MQTSKSLVVAQHAIPLSPLTGETKSQEHAIFLLMHCRSSDFRVAIGLTDIEPAFALARTKGKTTPNPRVRKFLIFLWNIRLEVEEVRKAENVKSTERRTRCQSEEFRHSQTAKK